MYQVDAFTDCLFAGNPAAVFVVEEFYPNQLMQALAAENNLAETAFVVPREDYFDLRWFTPAHEVAFCGHATLAAAHTLATEYDYAGTLTFQTAKMGRLRVTASTDRCYELDIPRLDPRTLEDDLTQALGCQPRHTFRNFENYFAVLNSADEVRAFAPDFVELSAVRAGGVCITAAGTVDDDYDFVSRYFAPRAGIPEDPVTGSTHASLVPYWAKELGMSNLRARQCSSRGGVLDCVLDDERVFLKGSAVTYLEGTVRLPSLFDV